MVLAYKYMQSTVVVGNSKLFAKENLLYVIYLSVFFSLKKFNNVDLVTPPIVIETLLYVAIPK